MRTEVPKTLKDDRELALRQIPFELQAGDLGGVARSILERHLRAAQKTGLQLGLVYALRGVGLGDHGVNAFILQHAPVLDRILDGEPESPVLVS